MKVVNTGNTYLIYDDNLKTYDQLPAKTYRLGFSKMTGFSLEENEDIAVKEKIYGPHQLKVNKIMNAFKAFERNLGVILSGDKGIGKSVCAKLLAQNAIAAGYPVILINCYVPGIADYLASIKQEVVVIFDEFDKTFKIKSDDEGGDSQSEMLALFDGMSLGKKMFVVTCNKLNNLNEFLVNRPGRFHYHLRFDYPTPAEVREYLQDKIPESAYGEIDKVISFSSRVDINYDCLRAIAFELAHGETFENAIRDLNIINTESRDEYVVNAIFEDGTKAVCKRAYVDFYGCDDEKDICLTYGDEGDYLYVTFDPNDNMYDSERNVTVVRGADLKDIEWSDRHGDCIEKDEDLPTQAKLLYLTFKRKGAKSIHYAV